MTTETKSTQTDRIRALNERHQASDHHHAGRGILSPRLVGALYDKAHVSVTHWRPLRDYAPSQTYCRRDCSRAILCSQPTAIERDGDQLAEFWESVKTNAGDNSALHRDRDQDSDFCDPQ